MIYYAACQGAKRVLSLFLSLSISSSTQNTDIRKSHNAIVEMAKADFFHCENIPDEVAESPRFKRLVKVCVC